MLRLARIFDFIADVLYATYQAENKSKVWIHIGGMGFDVPAIRAEFRAIRAKKRGEKPAPPEGPWR